MALRHRFALCRRFVVPLYSSHFAATLEGVRFRHSSVRSLSVMQSEMIRGSLSRREWMRMAGGVGMLAGLPAAATAQPASAAAEEAKAPPLPPLGAALPMPRITLLDGSEFEPARANGKSLLVYWWSSTCPFCALQSPSMDKLWQSQKDRGLLMVALSIDKKPEDAQAYLNAKGYRFPSAWASPEWRKGFPKPRGLPITLLRGRDGRLLLAEKGQMFAEDVEAIAGLI
jgi:hypothetical protein